MALAVIVLLALAFVAILRAMHRVPGKASITIVRAPLRRSHDRILQNAPHWTSSQIARLDVSLRSAFAPALAGADRWSLIVIAANGASIYENRATQAVTPASVQKLIVGSVAFDRLGPLYRYHTIGAALQPIAADGTLGGDLWLVGSGDPSLRSGDLRNGVAVLARAGLRHIAGRVVVDASSMDGPEINSNWDPDDANESFQVATSAISLDEDTAEFDVYGRAPGAAARVVVEPLSRAVRLDGEIVSSGGSDDVIIAASNTPNRFELHGAIPTRVEEKFWLPVHNIPRYVGEVVDRMLHARGVSTSSLASVGVAPLTSLVLWDHASKPLRHLEKHMLYVSDNHYAEQLLRTIASDVGTASSTSVGIAVERRILAEHAIPMPGLHLVDGSGLARNNRIAAITLGRILNDAQTRPAESALYAALPAAEKGGTLEYYDFTSARGRVRAKTGHISGVSSLAGYVNTRHHGRVSFAFLINGSPGDPDSAIVSAVDRISTY